MGEKKLNLLGVTSLSLVALIGTGMFFGPAIAASIAGQLSIFVWILLGINTLYVAFIFGELASMFPSAGGIYEFAKQTYGYAMSFFVGWVSWLVSTVTTSLLVVAAIQIIDPGWPDFTKILLALSIIILLHYVAYRGLGASEIILNFFAGVVLLFVIGAIIIGFKFFEPSNYQITTNLFENYHLIFLALFFVLETFFGWESACFLAEETKNPTKTIPKAIVISSAIGVLLMFFLALVIYGVYPVETISEGQNLVGDLFKRVFGDYGLVILSAGVFLSLIGSAAGNVVSSPRLLLAMARDKIFIEQLSFISKKTNTPSRAILFQGIASSIIMFIAFGDYKTLLSLMVPLALLMYVPVMLAVPILRRKQPGKREFSCPFPFVGPMIVALFFLGSFIGFLLFEPNSIGVVRFVASLLAVGIPIYVLVSTYYNPSTQLFFADALAFPALVLETIILPKKIRDKILNLFGDLEGKTVLELGAGVGSLTMHLANAVTPKGKVIAVEAGKKNLSLLLKRIRKARYEHVNVLHDEHITSRIHPAVDRVDAVYSLGMLGYLQDKAKILRELADVMPERGHVCFVEWMDYFGLIPDPAWLKNIDDLKNEFAKAGFSVHVEKVPGIFWNYLFVYGVKSKEKIPFA